MKRLAELLRMPKGTTETFIVSRDEESYFLKKLHTYALRTKAKVDYIIYVCVSLRDDSVARMIVVKVLKSGEQLKRAGRKSS